MSKMSLKAATSLLPVPVVLVSCGSIEKPNVITIAWTGTICSSPPMLSISIRPSRYSYNLIKESGEFVVNIPRADQVKTVDSCGIVSGKNINKFEKFNLTPVKSEKINTPMIKELPVNLECKVTEIKELGVHHLFLAEILTVHVDEKYYDKSRGIDIKRIEPFCYCLGDYVKFFEKIGSYGFTKRELGK